MGHDTISFPWDHTDAVIEFPTGRFERCLMDAIRIPIGHAMEIPMG